MASTLEEIRAIVAGIVSDYEVQAYGGGDDRTVQQLMSNYLEGLQELGYL